MLPRRRRSDEDETAGVSELRPGSLRDYNFVFYRDGSRRPDIADSSVDLLGRQRSRRIQVEYSENDRIQRKES